MAFDSFYSKENNSNAVIESMIIGKSDQRGFLRMDIKSKLTFKVNGGNETYEGTCKDLSATGVCFISGHRLNQGDVIEISIKPGVDITPPLVANVSVIRVKETDDNQFEIAGAIQEPSNT